MKRYAVLYVATLIVLIPVDFLFLGVVAKGFFTSEVGDMLGEIRLVPAGLFYLLYVAGVVVDGGTADRKLVGAESLIEIIGALPGCCAARRVSAWCAADPGSMNLGRSRLCGAA